MHFLKLAFAGMRRRLLSTALMLLATTIMLLCGATLGFWAQWVGGEQQNVRAGRSATVFVESAETGVLAQAVTKIRGMPGVAEARQIAVEEFMEYLRTNFPDIAQAMEGMTADAFPSLIEVVLPRDRNPEVRQKTFDEILGVPGVVRVDQGAKQIRGAVDSMVWLARAGLLIALGLWVVLVTIAIGHFQGIQLREAQEINLLRSFGASVYWICLPWVIEGLFYAFCGTGLSLLAFWLGRSYVAETFNQFFNLLGYDSFQIEVPVLMTVGVVLLVAASSAHILGGIVASVRGKLA